MFEGIFKRIYNDKNGVKLCSFGEVPINNDFKPFFGVFVVNF